MWSAAEGEKKVEVALFWSNMGKIMRNGFWICLCVWVQFSFVLFLSFFNSFNMVNTRSRDLNAGSCSCRCHFIFTCRHTCNFVFIFFQLTRIVCASVRSLCINYSHFIHTILLKLNGKRRGRLDFCIPIDVSFSSNLLFIVFSFTHCLSLSSSLSPCSHSFWCCCRWCYRGVLFRCAFTSRWFFLLEI